MTRTTNILQNHPAAIRARHLLVAYFKMLFDAQGLRFDSDNQAEIEDVVNNLFIAVSFLIANPEEINK